MENVLRISFYRFLLLKLYIGMELLNGIGVKNYCVLCVFYVEMGEYLVDSGRGFVVSGPSRVSVLEGELFVWGAPVKVGDVIDVVEGRSIGVSGVGRFSVEGDCEVVEVDYRELIPESWDKFIDIILEDERRPLKVMVLGDSSVGKSTFVTYATNRLCLEGLKVGVVDCDVGQSDIGPPTCVGVAFIDKPRPLFTQFYDDAFFVGSTSPMGLISRVVCGVRLMAERAEKENCDIVLVNTSGWVRGWGARELKTCVFFMVKPHYIAAIQYRNEIEHLLKIFKGFNVKIHIVDAPSRACERTSSQRKTFRELAYRKYLENGQLIKLALDKLSVLYGISLSGKKADRQVYKIVSSSLKSDVKYCEVSTDALFVLLKDAERFEQQDIRELRSTVRPLELYVTNEETIKNVIVGLFDEDGRFLGIGVLEDLDYDKREITIYTRVDAKKIAGIAFGYLKVDREGKEQGSIRPWTI